MSIIMETDAEYHARRATHLTSHALADFRACPLIYRQKQIGLIKQTESSDFLVGRALHVLALEGPDVYARRYAIGGPINPRTGKSFGSDTKAFAEWADAQGRPVLSQDQADLIVEMHRSICAHGGSSELLGVQRAHGIPEVTLLWERFNVKCQSRLDMLRTWHGEDMCVIDLKTTNNIDDFEHDARKYSYAHQMAFYRSAVRYTHQKNATCYLIAVEKRQPYRVGVWQVSDELLNIAESENDNAIKGIKLCIEMNNWPTNYELTRVLLPRNGG